MLKYQINRNNLSSDKILLPIFDYKTYYNSSTFNQNMNVELLYNKNIDIKIGDLINILVEVPLNSYSDDVEYYSENHCVANIDLTNNAIELSIPKYIELYMSSFKEVEEANDEFWWYIQFTQKHYFINESKIIFQYFNTNTDLMTDFELNSCIVVDEYTIKHKFNKDTDRDIGKLIFQNNIQPRGNVINATVGVFKREHFLNGNYNISFFKTSFKLGVSIPLVNTHDISVSKQFSVNENFIDCEKSKVLNKPIEMEKNIFVPVCKYWENAETRDKEIISDVFKINFNIHLRKHNGKEWQTTDEDFWNGVTYNKLNKLIIDKNYFAPQYVNNVSFQSDLISELGFNDADVRYQKSKLKKTFLRLSFYDSPYPGSQNLLSYSTIFLDSNKLSGNMIRNSFQKNYKYYNQKKGTILKHLEGLHYNREIDFEITNGIVVNQENCENYRLSSQFSVLDKNYTNNSSEGFYLYLWKDMTEGVVPTDLYLKIELNHAGFGRTIPLMMPYFAEKVDEDWDGKTEDSWVVVRDAIQSNELKYGEGEENGQTFGIKSFNDIVNDWNHGGYNIQKYLKYTFIHLKCQFDKTTNRYIYYLDNTFYENCNKIFNKETNTLNFNLYEAKVCDSTVTTTNINNTPYTLVFDVDNICPEPGGFMHGNFIIKIINKNDNQTTEEINFGETESKYTRSGNVIERESDNKKYKITYYITYNLNTENHLWLNYYKTETTNVDNKNVTYQDEFTDITFGDNEGNCKLTINYLDSNKNNVESYSINELSNPFYLDYVDINNELNVVDFNVEVIYTIENGNDTEEYVLNASKIVTSSFNQQDTDNKSKYKIVFQKSEFVFNTIPDVTNVGFYIEDEKGDVVSQIDSENLLVENVSLVTDNDIKGQLVLNASDDVVGIEKQTTNNNSKYTNNIKFNWDSLKLRNNIKTWKSWKFMFYKVTYNLTVNNETSEKIQIEKYLYFVFLPLNFSELTTPEYYYITSKGWYDEKQNKQIGDVLEYSDGAKFSFNFKSCIIPFRKNGKINYNGDYTHPKSTDFNIKMTGVKSFDTMSILSNKSNAAFKVIFYVRNKQCQSCGEEYTQPIQIWVKSRKFNTLSATKKQKVIQSATNGN